MKKIPVLQPSCTDDEVNAVTKVLRSNWWGQGPVTESVEKLLCEMYQRAYCVAVNSCTAALHLALLANHVGPGDEVIVPALTFISTALAVSYVGATPVFGDVHPDTLCLSLEDVRSKVTPKTKAIIPVDFAGHPANDFIAYNGHVVIQDAAHSCGSLGYGDEVCLSFHPVKNIATGDGGAILTRDKDHYLRMKALRWCGIDSSTWERVGPVYNWDYHIDEIGYKYHWNDIQAAIGLVQLQRRQELLERRREIAGYYTERLKALCETPRDDLYHTWHLYPIRVEAERRDSIVDYMLQHGVTVGVHYKPLTMYPQYKQSTPPVTDREWRRLISLPIFYDLTDNDLCRVVDVVRDALTTVTANS